MDHCQSHQGNHGVQEASAAVSADEKRLQAQLGDITHKLLVMSGKGGVGKSSVASYLALGLARRGCRVGLMDVDLHGPDIPRMLGIQGMFQMDQEQRIIPHKYNENLAVVSIECMLADRDTAVIWRGPLKHRAIKQFLSEVNWGGLDYLIIDAPPGTGDEPLTVAQTIPGVKAVIVTTPQEISAADVRKAINFCRKVKMPILGLVENMSGLICPHCGGEIPLFSKGGGRKTAASMRVPFLASLPFDLRVVKAADRGAPLLEAPDNSPFIQALGHLVDEVENLLKQKSIKPVEKSAEIMLSEVVVPDSKVFKVAIPLTDGKLCNHFGHCEQFAVMQVKEGSIDDKELQTPPPHEPEVLPKWLGDLGVNLVIAGSMGQRALGLFAERGIKVITGARNRKPEALVQDYLAGALISGPNVCDH